MHQAQLNLTLSKLTHFPMLLLADVLHVAVTDDNTELTDS